MTTADIIFIQGEADPEVQFTLTDSDGTAIDVSSATLGFEVKKNMFDTSPAITKTDSDFDKTDAVDGIVKLPFSSSDTNMTPTTYIGELTVTFSSTNISKQQIIIVIKKQV